MDNQEKKARILVVDDEERNLRLLEAMLIPLGYEVMLIADSEKTLTWVKQWPPDVILMDVMMPNMDGYEVTRQIKSDPATHFISVVMVTALSDVAERVRALDAGADDFLSKPVDKVELRARVKSLVQVKAYHDQQRHYQQELEREVARKTSQLEAAFVKIKETSLDTIFRLSRAAEYRDEYTGGHIKRMSNYAAAIARQIKLGEHEVETVLYAAPMHDLGKIGIPDHILLKPGKLAAAEWVIMKQHSLIGEQILSGSELELIKVAAQIALSHHERWDGGGYPSGLKGAAIPILAQVTAIADVFDALTSKRPYKQAYPLETAYQIIREGRGTHFAPDLVDAFFAVEKEILGYREKFPDDDISLLYRMINRIP